MFICIGIDCKVFLKLSIQYFQQLVSFITTLATYFTQKPYSYVVIDVDVVEGMVEDTPPTSS